MESKYNPELHPMIVGFWRMKGLSMIKIANKMGMSSNTLKDWIKKKPEMRQVWKDATVNLVDKVESGLLKKALGGYETEEITNYKDSQNETVKSVTKTIEHDPDIRAIALYLQANAREKYGTTIIDPKADQNINLIFDVVSGKKKKAKKDTTEESELIREGVNEQETSE